MLIIKYSGIEFNNRRCVSFSSMSRAFCNPLLNKLTPTLVLLKSEVDLGRTNIVILDEQAEHAALFVARADLLVTLVRLGVHDATECLLLGPAHLLLPEVLPRRVRVGDNVVKLLLADLPSFWFPSPSN